MFFFADLVMYANTYAGLNNPPSTWYDTFEKEIRAFVGFNILVDLQSLPTITDFWSTNECLHARTDFNSLTATLCSIEMSQAAVSKLQMRSCTRSEPLFRFCSKTSKRCCFPGYHFQLMWPSLILMGG